MKVLVLNSGSSSIKYRLFRLESMEALRAGVVDRIGEAGSSAVRDHGEGFGRVMSDLMDSGAIGDLASLFGVGHRVVHGGERFREPTRVEAGVLEAIREMIPFAPLQNPGDLLGIETTLATFPGVIRRWRSSTPHSTRRFEGFAPPYPERSLSRIPASCKGNATFR